MIETKQIIIVGYATREGMTYERCGIEGARDAIDGDRLFADWTQRINHSGTQYQTQIVKTWRKVGVWRCDESELHDG